MPRSDAVPVDDAPKGRAAAIPLDEPPPPDDSYSGRFWWVWQNTKDEARLAGNTFDAYDRIAAYLGDNNAAALKAERAKTEAASQRLGPIDSAIAYGAGYLPLALAGGAAGLGPIATSAVGGALAGAGHSEATDPSGIAIDAAKAAAINAATGGVLTRAGPYAPSLARNAITHFAPRVAGGYLGSHFGPAGAWIGSEIARELAPAARPLTPMPRRFGRMSIRRSGTCLSSQGL